MITINIDKAKAIGHDLRRAARGVEFAPLDEIVAKQIPGSDFAAIEAERQAIRNKYSVMQAQIDAAASIDELKSALP